MHVSDQRINFPCKICASSARGIGFARFTCIYYPILYCGRCTRRDRRICTIPTKCCARETTQPYTLIMFKLRCINKSTALIAKCVQSVHIAQSVRKINREICIRCAHCTHYAIGIYEQSVRIAHKVRAALIGKYAAPWSGGQFSLQGHLPTKHCSNTNSK